MSILLFFIHFFHLCEEKFEHLFPAGPELYGRSKTNYCI